MTTLANLDGDAFDEMFLTMMIAHHAGAIDAAERVLEGLGSKRGQRPVVRHR